MQQKDKEILSKYINSQAGVDEQARAEKLLSSNSTIGIKEFMKSDWKQRIENDENLNKDLSSVLDKVHHAIRLRQNKNKRNLSHSLYKWFSAAAAIVIVPLIVTGVFTLIKLKETNKLLSENASTVFVEAPKGAKIAFKMPDGSDVVLNGGSSMEYAVPFSNKRDVRLTGEAYFDIKHDEEHPFFVSTQKIKVKVLGTRFNVHAYADEDLTEVILEQGKVECFIGGYEIMMSPNEMVSLKGTKYSKKEVNASKYIAWKDGKLVFRGDSMDEVARRISRWYNVEVEIKGAELSMYSFRATFQNDSLEEVLRLLKLSSPIDYKIVARKKLTDGSFSKKKVIIYNKS
ncbi:MULTISPECIES: FecR family protein [unclassified Saccharicrinis]|uniref:FecR family protein n=1 Tax=unclassified Saccharicrinis TaxID=2646859 RepID=UPI003D3275B7